MLCLHLKCGGQRNVNVAFVFEEPEATVNYEAVKRWARAAAHRRDAGAEVKYKVDVDWSRYTSETFKAVDTAVVRLWTTALSANPRPHPQVIDEVDSISSATWQAAYGDQSEPEEGKLV